MLSRLASSCLALTLLALSFAPAQEKTLPAFKLSEAEQKLLELTNAERTKANLPSFKANPLLFQCARKHSLNMAKQEKLEHDLDGKSSFERLDEVKYDYQRGGENIARTDVEATMAEVLKIWMDSPGHRASILKADFTEIGLGIAKNAKGDVYFTQVFATPAK